MSSHRRPTAFEVSFPEEVCAMPDDSESTTPDATPSRDGKRKNEAERSPPARARKRSRNLHRMKTCYYVPKPHEILETNLVMPEEDIDLDVTDSGPTEDKPVRILSSFTFFDPKHDLEMISLSVMEEVDGIDRHFEGAGFVIPLLLNEEDDGQLEDLVGEQHQPYVRLSSIIRYSIDYSKKDDPVFIETLHAFYILHSPSRLYKPYFRSFYTPYRTAQLVITAATTHPNQSYGDFLNRFTTIEDHLLQQKIKEDDLKDAVSNIKDAVEEQDDPDTLMKVPFLKHLLRHVVPEINPGRRKRRRSLSRGLNIRNTALLGNLDLAVLRPENQQPTHVTPLIASLASGLFRETFVVVGPRPVRPNEDIVRKQERQAFVRLRILVEKTCQPKKYVTFKNDQRLKPRSYWLRSVTIDGETYHIGDVIVVPIGQHGDRKAPEIPDPNSLPAISTIQDYFWFAKIVHISGEDETAHVQWFWHSSTTAIEDLANPQELFLADLCDIIDLQVIAGKVVVHYHDPISQQESNVKHDEFFYKFVYDPVMSTYTDIDQQRSQTANCDEPPDNCPVCLLVEQKDQESYGHKLPTGVAYHGINFHIHDFALIRADNGPCHVGYIMDIRFSGKSQHRGSPTIMVKLLGRVSNLGVILPHNVIKDERHLFLTDDQMQIKLEDLIRVCYVFPHESIPDVDFWTSLSADHFYVQYRFPSLNVRSWNDKQPVYHDIDVCVDCCREKLAQVKLTKAFLSFAKREPLQAFDLFGGVGAFGLGMEESGFLKVTHAVEISPSAAKTFKRNSPDTIVYNDCANTVLRYAIKSHEGHKVDVPVIIHDDIPLPDPPAPDMIDIFLAGFPCQSHSALNMFRKAEDLKSNLILTALSWIDFLRPKICVLENVRGFLQFNLDATQVGKHKVEGGIDMGGVKLVLRALTAMNYQVRYGLLQAAHYGTPQTRIRFFLMAAQSGYPLPELPQATHDFPLADALAIKLPIGNVVRPIRTANGTAPHPFVTIDDAISDLPRFDWKNPGQSRETSTKQREARDRERFIPTLVCKRGSSYCGYQGVMPYYHEPKTTYQVRSRKRATTDLQHYTRNLLPAKVERVCNIPLVPKADYKGLRPDLLEWQLANPASAVAKGGFRSGWYGRLDKDSWFSTTVTNVDPTAKQSKVLNPYCKRMVTVRELARSQGFPDHFVFESINNNVVTLHRQIGNAVPWLVSAALGKEIQISVFKKWLERMNEESSQLVD